MNHLGETCKETVSQGGGGGDRNLPANAANQTDAYEQTIKEFHSGVVVSSGWHFQSGGAVLGPAARCEWQAVSNINARYETVQR